MKLCGQYFTMQVFFRYGINTFYIREQKHIMKVSSLVLGNYRYHIPSDTCREGSK
jgi:hypothetical protein